MQSSKNIGCISLMFAIQEGPFDHDPEQSMITVYGRSQISQFEESATYKYDDSSVGLLLKKEFSDPTAKTQAIATAINTISKKLIYKHLTSEEECQTK